MPCNSAAFSQVQISEGNSFIQSDMFLILSSIWENIEKSRSYGIALYIKLVKFVKINRTEKNGMKVIETYQLYLRINVYMSIRKARIKSHSNHLQTRWWALGRLAEVWRDTRNGDINNSRNILLLHSPSGYGYHRAVPLRKADITH